MERRAVSAGRSTRVPPAFSSVKWLDDSERVAEVVEGPRGEGREEPMRMDVRGVCEIDHLSSVIPEEVPSGRGESGSGAERPPRDLRPGDSMVAGNFPSLERQEADGVRIHPNAVEGERDTDRIAACSVDVPHRPPRTETLSRVLRGRP